MTDRGLTTTPDGRILTADGFPLVENREVPAIRLAGDRIRVLYEPSAFYADLKSRILKARQRVYLSTLYIGHQEADLVATLEQALAATPQLEVRILFDGLRGTRAWRTGQSPADLFVPLLQRYPDRLRVALYHTPNLHGAGKRYFPERYNEVVGLMHIKAYVFDNDIVLSGANLSRDYFTNRQDRYVAFEDAPQLAMYYSQLADEIAAFSYGVRPIDRTRSVARAPGVASRGIPQPVVMSARPEDVDTDGAAQFRLVMMDDFPDPVTRPREFRVRAGDAMQRWLRTWADGNHRHRQSMATAMFTPADPTLDTLLVPTIQMHQLNVDQDRRYFHRLLGHLDRYAVHHPATTVRFTSAYFNFAPSIQSLILRSHAHFDMTIAAPEANGFFNARGISRYVPTAYSSFEHEFYNRAQRALRNHPSEKRPPITLREYARDGWTFHGKGLWVYFRGEPTPALSVLGSSNYGYRSLTRDFEAQAMLYTRNERLRTNLHREIADMARYTNPVTDATFGHPARRVPRWVRMIKPLIRGFF
ncbi:CDP-diacylglycerol--glycerol-3-phosphate 3-phosphatidyltransferase [Tieghemiomyces parasiticus]|uniref:CDP-diacylglycerol--glycerol-3-phosphate 3-phosphatidyltransferase n=1 Tax=Tieghemiomyces parasiticus TaxID=78921 RepID=A0A9W8A739_9FUNG|nr:CDP-diacylglycerol--glycerol-3-phosphate 3-phosphatidyltransferase [Tieghemiomyces parasiticus]